MTEYSKKQLIENDRGWLFYDAAFKCWKNIYGNVKGNSVLDIGCGGGVSIALMQIFNPFLKIEGFEGSEEGREIWDFRKIKVTSGNIYKLPYSDGAFDTVYSSHVLEHCEKPQEVILESMRVASNRVIHVVPDGDVNQKNFGSPHLHIFNRKNYLQLFDIPKLSIVQFSSIQDYHMNSLIIVCDIN